MFNTSIHSTISSYTHIHTTLHTIKHEISKETNVCLSYKQQSSLLVFQRMKAAATLHYTPPNQLHQ